MDEVGRKILKNIAQALPDLTAEEKVRVLGFSEGLGYKVRNEETKEEIKGV